MISAVDTTLGQFSADGVLVALVLINAYVGWRTGSLHRLLALAGLYVGFIAAYYSGNSFASLVSKSDLFTNAWVFVGVVTIVVLVFELLGRVFKDRIQLLAVMAFDRFAGLIVGAVVGFFEAVVLFMVALAVGTASPGATNSLPINHDAAANAVRTGTLSGQAIRVAPAVRRAFDPLIGTDLATHLQDGTQATPPAHP